MQFRELRRIKQKLSEQETIALLKRAKRAVIAMNGSDYPYCVPINYVYDEKNKALLFHAALEGKKHDLMERDNRVCVTVFEDESIADDGWSKYVLCAVALGRVSILEGEDKLRALTLLGDKYFPTHDETVSEIEKHASRCNIYSVYIDNLCGKRVHEK